MAFLSMGPFYPIASLVMTSVLSLEREECWLSMAFGSSFLFGWIIDEPSICMIDDESITFRVE